MRFEESFTVGRPPEQMFDYLTDPATLAGACASIRVVIRLDDRTIGALNFSPS